MSKIFTKIREFVGLDDPQYDDDEIEIDDGGRGFRPVYPPESHQVLEEDLRPRRRVRERISIETNPEGAMNNVIGMPGSGRTSEVIVMEPRSFDDMPQVIQALRERKSVVLNLTMMDPDLAQRAVDFVAGGTYATDGHQERVGESIFLFTPSCVQVTTQSGAVHEVPQTQQLRTERTTVTSQVWSPDSTRIAQSS